MKKYLALTALFVASVGLSYSQTKPEFWEDVQAIKAYDRMYQPAAHPILFIGSSSIRKWEHLQQAFGAYNVLNRGIGGAVIDDITFYLKDIVFPYAPRQIVLYVGENDLVKDNETAEIVFSKTVRLYKAIREKMPAVPIVYMAMKPSPSRDQFGAKAMAANKLISAYLAKEKNTVFVDVFKLMLDQNGKSRPELFVEDMLHMNPAGYDIWEKAVKPHLLK